MFERTVSDLDEARNNGFYSYNSNVLNNPHSSGGSVIVAKSSSNYFTQIAFPNSSDNSVGFFRRTHGSNGYTEWKHEGTQSLTTN